MRLLSQHSQDCCYKPGPPHLGPSLLYFSPLGDKGRPCPALSLWWQLYHFPSTGFTAESWPCPSVFSSHTPLQAITEFTFDLLDLSLPRTEYLVDRTLRAKEVVTAATSLLGPKEAAGQAHLTRLRLKPPCSAVLEHQDVCETWVVENCSCPQVSLVLEADV